MKEFLNERKKELSTYTIGLPMLIMGVSEIFKINEGQGIADAVSQAGAQYLHTGDWRTGAAYLGIGLLGVFGTFGKRSPQK